MPTSVKLQEQYGDDVQVIFVECQNTPKDTYEAFAWKSKWMGNGAMWTIERPMPTVGQGLPETAVLGIDGTVLMQGNPGNFGKKLEAAVAAEVKKSKEVPTGTAKEITKAWQLFLKDDVTGAIAECDKLTSDPAIAAKAEFVARTTARIDRVKRVIDAGEIGEAEKLLALVEKAAKGNASFADKIALQRARLATPEIANEREADKAFTSFVVKVSGDKPFEQGNVKKAESIASKYKGTKTAARAEHFVALSKVELNK